jgi:hypothetical protein
MKTSKRADKTFRPKTKSIIAGATLEEKSFHWDVDQEYYTHGNLAFFYQYTLPVLREYERKNMTWKQIKKHNPKAHEFMIMGIQNPSQRKAFEKFRDKRKIDSDSFFQIPGKASDGHRIIGYRGNNGFFYLIRDDEHHEMLRSGRQ